MAQEAASREVADSKLRRPLAHIKCTDVQIGDTAITKIWKWRNWARRMRSAGEECGERGTGPPASSNETHGGGCSGGQQFAE